MQTAVTNGFSLHAYFADNIILKRTDSVVLELRGNQKGGSPLALWRGAQRTLFQLELFDPEGKPIGRTSEGERRLAEPQHTVVRDGQRPVPLVSGRNAYTERFNLSELYTLRPGRDYVLRVSTRIKSSETPPTRSWRFP